MGMGMFELAESEDSDYGRTMRRKFDLQGILFLLICMVEQEILWLDQNSSTENLKKMKLSYRFAPIMDKVYVL